MPRDLLKINQIKKQFCWHLKIMQVLCFLLLSYTSVHMPVYSLTVGARLYTCDVIGHIVYRSNYRLLTDLLVISGIGNVGKTASLSIIMLSLFVLNPANQRNIQLFVKPKSRKHFRPPKSIRFLVIGRLQNRCRLMRFFFFFANREIRDTLYA